MRKLISALLIVIVLFCLLILIGDLEKRVQALEKQCHALCLYGDAECAARCAKAGHCPFQKEN